MTAGGTYVEGATIRLSALFTVDGAATDPTTVTLKVKDPSDSIDTYVHPADVTKTGAGAFYKDVTPDAVGEWYYRWIGTGTAAGVGESSFLIQPSEID